MHTNQSPTPVLALVVRQATATWQTLTELKSHYVPSPLAAIAPPSSSDNTLLPKKTATPLPKDEKGRHPRVAPFDLRKFLDEREDGASARMDLG